MHAFLPARVAGILSIGILAGLCVTVAGSPAIAAEVTYTSAASITIDDLSAATPYPSTIVVPDSDVTAQDIRVSLQGLSHGNVNDLDILLVGPAGQAVMLMSDVGGNRVVSSLDLDFEDYHNSLTTAALTTGIHKPTDLEAGESLPGPAPGAPYGKQLSTFVGRPFGGTWSLYVSDDRSGQTGTLAGWSLTFETNAWQPASTMLQRRDQHTATRLPDGDVLVVGGRFLSDVLGAAERWEESTGSWIEQAPLSTPRALHTATLLPTRRVLVAGGYHYGQYGQPAGGTADCRLFDPITGAWSLTDSLSEARGGHTATLLADGRLLIVGGRVGDYDLGFTYLGSAEIYGPSTGTWSAAGSIAAREEHTASRLPDGRVLVTGGFNGTTGITNADIYDPSTGLWSAVAPLPVARAGHTATVLEDGRVLVVGGRSTPSFLTLSTTAVIWDPGTDAWTATTGSPTSKRSWHTATLLPDGRVLVSGGYAGSSTNAATEVFDPASDAWTLVAQTSHPRFFATATLLEGGRVLMAGGTEFNQFENDEWTASAEMLTPSAPAWSAVAPMSIARMSPNATLLEDGRVLAVGGYNAGAGGNLASAEIFDPQTGTWTMAASLSGSPDCLDIALLSTGGVLATTDGGAAQIYSGGSWAPAAASSLGAVCRSLTVLGDGRVLGVTNGAAEIYDPTAATWSTTSAPSVFGSNVLLADGRVLRTYASGSQVFDPASGTWTSTASPAFSHDSYSLLPDGRVLGAGGYTPSVGPLRVTEIYDPASGLWTDGPPMIGPRDSSTAVVLGDGRVLVVGGFDLRTAEVFDPATESWTVLRSTADIRYLSQLVVLADGRPMAVGGREGPSSESLRLDGHATARQPALTAAPSLLTYPGGFQVTGTGFRGDSEAHGGDVRGSAAARVFSLQALSNGRRTSLVPDATTTLGADPLTFTFSTLPNGLDAGWHRLTVVSAGVASESWLLRVGCSVSVASSPSSVEIAIGASTTLTVSAMGARSIQWQRNAGAGWVDIDGETGSSLVTPPMSPVESGIQYRAVVKGNCGAALDDEDPEGTAISAVATVTASDTEDPDVSVLSPAGGEYLLLSESGAPANRHLVTWSMADDIRVCRVTATLTYSTDGGNTYQSVPTDVNFDPSNTSGGGVQVFGASGACSYPGETTTSLEYPIPTAFPSGSAGSLYKVEVSAEDQVGNVHTAKSTNAFYIVKPNPDSVRTLIVSKLSRMSGSTAELALKLQELAAHPRVQGLIVDLDANTDVNALYAAWDADPSSADRANAVLFGCHGGVPAGCGVDREGIHDTLGTLRGAYTGVRYLVLVGDDHVLPFTRLEDGTTLLPESTYPSATPGGNLTSTGSTVGRALFGGSFLSDDPVTSADALTTASLPGSLFVPDLAVSRLVESPAEIKTVIATFISQDGVLDLSALDPETGRKVLVTGYDFLTDSAKQVSRRWKGTLCALIPAGPGRDDCVAASAEAPIDATLTEGNWGFGSVSQRVGAMREALSGHEDERYAVASLSGHATHFEEGVPGTDPFDIKGLGTIDVYGAEPVVCAPPSTSLGALDLAGSIAYAVGCHGGLPVTGSCFGDADHSLDLPQTMMSRGVVAYVANTGYGWGLKYGIGYSERLMELFTEELTSGGTVVVGDAVRAAKQRYFLETPRYDAYDEKSLMQWTLFGLPMYAIKTGLAVSAPVFAGPAPSAPERPDYERFGAVGVERRIVSGAGPSLAGAPSAPAPNAALPAYLTQLNLSFDFSASGVYEKHEADGDVLPDGTPGCPDGEGCYYTLNGIVQRSTGNADLPIQPYFIYDSRLSGTSQHGVLWKGGTYEEETGWVPVIATLQSNADIPTDHGSAPRVIKLSGIAPRLVPGADPAECRPSELEVNSLVVDAGEALKDETSDPSYTIERRYRQIDLEVFYSNDRTTPNNNCDRTGPQIDPGPFAGAYHEAVDTTVTWAVPVCDAWPTATCDPAQVWRVLVVTNDNQVDGSNRGTWVPLELTNDAGTWRGSHAFTGTSRVTYVIQAVDKRGNVTWLDYASVSALGLLAPSPTPPDEPDSGVPLGVPATVDVELGGAAPALAVTGLQPTLGPVGGKVTLTGSGFTQVTAVEFGSASASFVLISDGELRATVPIGAESGPITVRTATSTAHSPSFRVTRAPLLSITDVRVSESRRTATLQVSLSAASSRTVTVTYATVDGTASAGSDYTARRGTLRFLPGTRVKTVTVPIVSDRRDEPNETFRVTLSNPSNAGVARPTGTVTILDDDAP